MRLIVAPDPALRVRCRSVELFDGTLRRLVDGMLDVMYTHDGVGLAAPQVGSDLRAIVVDPSAGERAPECLVMINPTIVRTASSTLCLVETTEGCLSFPDRIYRVTRPDVVTVSWTTLYNEPRSEQFTGFSAHIVQHEIQHLDGILLPDIGTRTTFRERMDSSKKVRKV